MYKLCVFAGTADGRQLVERLAGQAEILACAATEYGGELLEEIPGVEVSAQRLDENQMEELFRQRQFDCVIDATHPYAPIVTENIRSACEKTDTSYLRLLRDGGLPEGCLFADSTAQAVEMLKTLPGNILLTTGSKELAAYAALPDYAQRAAPSPGRRPHWPPPAAPGHRPAGRSPAEPHKQPIPCCRWRPVWPPAGRRGCPPPISMRSRGRSRRS